MHDFDAIGHVGCDDWDAMRLAYSMKELRRCQFLIQLINQDWKLESAL